MLNHEQHAILKDVQRTGGFIIPTDKKGKFKGADGEVIKGLTSDMLDGFKENGLVTEPAEGTADAGTLILSPEVPEVLGRADLVSKGGDMHDETTNRSKVNTKPDANQNSGGAGQNANAANGGTESVVTGKTTVTK